MDPNALRWDGTPGHYEVWYLTLTEQSQGMGLWLRYAVHAPAEGAATCALWCVAMAPDGERFARRESLPASELAAEDAPFRLRVGGAELSHRGATGTVADAEWRLSWTPRAGAVDPVHRLLRRARVPTTRLLRRARVPTTRLLLSHPDLAVDGSVRLGDRTLQLRGARGTQAHLWGSRHAERWAWAHCNDLRGTDGSAREGAWIDGVSVVAERLGREAPPATPVVGCLLGDRFRATAPEALVRARSALGLSAWRFEARDGARRVVGDVAAPRHTLAGVTYRDPDGRPAYCYNSEVASLRLHVWDRVRRGRFGWALRDTLVADGRAHFEYAQRSTVEGVELLLT